MAPLASPEQSRHGLGLDQLTRLVEVVQDHGGGIDAEGVVDRGEQLAWMNGIRQRRRAGLVGLAVDVAPLDARTGDHGREQYHIPTAFASTRGSPREPFV